jgi:hypothetical protein
VKSSAIEKVKREVARQFPEMTGIKPSVRKQGSKKNQDDQYLLTFKGTVELPGGKKMSRIVRVVADERGHVVKMSTSK